VSEAFVDNNGNHKDEGRTIKLKVCSALGGEVQQAVVKP